MSLDVRNPGLHELIAPDALIERVGGGFVFTEGPVWRGDALLFSDIPNNRIARWRRLPEGPELTTFTTGHSNGLTLDREGKLLAAEHGGRGVSRIAHDGMRTGRGVPDVAGDADPATGYQILVDGHQAVFGGTSAVAPLWAALIARLNQQLGHPVGYLNPLLYGRLLATAGVHHHLVGFFG